MVETYRCDKTAQHTAQSIMKDLEKQGLLHCPRDDTKAYFEITQAGQKVLEENSVKESGE